MSVGEMLAGVWDMFKTVGFTVFDVFVSMADIFVFVILAGLFILFLKILLGGGDK